MNSSWISKGEIGSFEKGGTRGNLDMVWKGSRLIAVDENRQRWWMKRKENQTTGLQWE